MKRFLCVLSLVLVCACLYAQDVKLTILHTNDIHGQMTPLDYVNKNFSMTNVGGAARRATLINTIRKETKNRVFLFDAGDISNRGQLVNFFAEPEIKVMNYMKYDLMTVGNNDLKLDEHLPNKSPEAVNILKKRISEANFPVISANVYDKITNKRSFTPYVIFKEKGVRIAVVGFTSLKCRNYVQTVNLTFTDPFEEMDRVLSELKGKYDFLIVLSHLGDLSDYVLASKYSEIGLIIEGDFHTFLEEAKFIPHGTPSNKYIGGTLIVQDGEFGVKLGKIDFTLSKSPDKSYKISKYDYKLIPITDKYQADKNVETILKVYFDQQKAK